MKMRVRIAGLAAVAALSLACTASHPDRVVEPTPTVLAAVPHEPVTITVVVEHTGRSEFEIERAVVVPLEQALAAIPGVARIHSRAAAGHAMIVLSLEASADPERSRVAVHERLRSARASLPDDAMPTIGPDLARPAGALIFTLSPTTATDVELHAAADALREALYTVPGVGAVETCGGREPRLVVAVDPRRMQAYGLPPGAVARALTASLRDAPRAAADLRIASRPAYTMEALSSVIVAAGEQAVAIRDVASVTVTPTITACDAARTGGGPVVLGSVRARRGADAAATEAGVRARLATLTTELAGRGVALEVPAAPLRLALDVRAGAAPGETLVGATRMITKTLAAAGPAFAGRPAYVRAMTPSEGHTRVDGALVLEASGLDAEEVSRLDRALDLLPGVRVRGTGLVDAMGELDDPSLLRLWICGDELTVDRRLALEAAEIAATVPGVVRAASRDDERVGLTLDLRRERLAALGLTGGDLTATIAATISGVEVGEVEMNGASMPVIVRVGEQADERATRPETLQALEIGLPAGGSVRLGELVDIRVAPEPGAITRVDRRRAVGVEVRLAAPSPALRGALQRAIAASLELPPGHVVVWEPAAP